MSVGPLRLLKSAQKPALPVVSRQEQKMLLGWHGMAVCSVQVSVSGKQTPLLWATQVDEPGSQMPEQQRVLSPWQGWPMSRQPNSLNGGGGGGGDGIVGFGLCLRLLWCLFLAAASPSRMVVMTRPALASPRRTSRREGRPPRER